MSFKSLYCTISKRVFIALTVIVIAFLLVGSLLTLWSDGSHHVCYAPWGSLINICNKLKIYEQQNGHLPPATVLDPESGELSSWRLAVYLASHPESDVTAPGENDKKSNGNDRHKARKAPENPRLEELGFYRFQYTPENGHTRLRLDGDRSAYYKAITGPGTAFDPTTPRSLEELPNDLILVARVEQSNTHWMETGDLNVEQLDASEKTKRLLSGKNGYAVLFADGEAWILSDELPVSELRKFFTIDGAKRYDRDKILEPYQITPLL